MALAGILNLDGERRRSVAEGLWTAWREQGRLAATLVGISGVGKTERVIDPLVARAREAKSLAIRIDVPAQPTDLEQELLARISEALEEINADQLAKEVDAASDLATGLRRVLGAQGLVVIDEFQRLLQLPSGTPIEPFAEKLEKLARRPADGGALWLVSNRSIDPIWTEPFHVAILEAPTEARDAIRIVVEALATSDANDRVPEARYDEVARRFGRNPRALRLLGHLLRAYDLEELIGPPRAISEGLTEEELANDIERSLLVRAREGLSNAASELLRELTVLPEFAPMALIEAVGGHLGPIPALLGEIHQRFLIDQRHGLRQVHPIVREVELPRLARHQETYRAANLKAGQWYAAHLAAAGLLGDEAALVRNLAGARHHLLAAAKPETLKAALEAIRPYMERRFHWAGRIPNGAAERDAQISLLELFLQEPDTPAIEFQLAKRLEARGQGDDLSRAIVHAERSTIGQDFSHPWILLLQLAYHLHGPEAAVAFGPEAIRAVDPAKDLASVYQTLAIALSHLGRDEEAVELCLEGVDRSHSNEVRVLGEAITVAAAMEDTGTLKRIRGWAEKRGPFGLQVALADVLLHERAGNWRAGAERAQVMFRQRPNYLYATMHETLCWLGVGSPDMAQRALDGFPGGLRFSTRNAVTWLAALVALRCGDAVRAQKLTEIYLGGPAPVLPREIESRLLWEWDTRIRKLGEASPAVVFPVLPPSLSGLSMPVIRPQHGTAVLPQHSTVAVAEDNASAARLRVLAIGTEWASGQGGLSTFNRQLCRALAAAGVDVTCLVINPSAAEIDEAKEAHVRLIPAKRTPGVDEREWLARRPSALNADYAPDFIIGHGRITGPAADRLNDLFPNGKRLHFVHMAPDEIEWHKSGRDGSAGILAESRTKLELELGKSAYRVVAVGPRLFDRYSRDLHPLGPPIRFDPGFDEPEQGVAGPPRGAPWKVLLMGRMEDYSLKGVDLAAQALGRVAQRRRAKGLPEIELYVRGAMPEDVDVLRRDLITWANSPHLPITVRAYTTDEAALSDDLHTSSLVLMPSRTEGFGLVGLEAITIGTPTLISSKSGLAQMLREELDTVQAARLIVETSGAEGFGEEDVDEWERAIENVLGDRDAAFRRASELRTYLSGRHTWCRSVEDFLSSLTETPGRAYEVFRSPRSAPG